MQSTRFVESIACKDLDVPRFRFIDILQNQCAPFDFVIRTINNIVFPV